MSQAVTRDEDKLVYVVFGPDATAYHTNSSWQYLRQGKRDVHRVSISTLVDRDICAFCDGFEHSGANWKNGECRSCGIHVGEGDCPFCDVFDLIHGVDRDAQFCAIGSQRGES